jgi:pilus assembly protein CpaE
MSEEDKSYTETLLPAASITLFTEDSKTRKVFMTLEDDWRFARVTFEAETGSVEEAVKLYAKEDTPDLIIIQSDKVDDEFLENLEALSDHCSEGTSAIVIGPDNDVDLYRKLVGMGVSDYLVKPVKLDVFGADIASTLLKQIGSDDSRLIVTVGVKGGVGTTVLTEGLAWGLSDKLHQKTFLLDAAAGWTTLPVGMSFEPTTTLERAARSAGDGTEESLSRMLYEASERLTILSSGSDVMLEDNVEYDEYENLLDFLMQTYPVVLVDLSASTPILKNTVLSRAHEIVIVTTPTLTAVRAARTLIQEIKELRGGSGDAIDLVVNMQGLAPKSEVSKSQIEEALERKVSVVIPSNPALFVETESQAKRLIDDKAGSEIVDKILSVVQRVLNGHANNDNEDAAVGDKKVGIGHLLDKLKTK